VVDRAVFDRRYVLSIQAASTRGVTPGTRELARVLAESSRAQGVGSRPGQRSDSLAPHLAGCRWADGLHPVVRACVGWSRNSLRCTYIRAIQTVPTG